MHLNQLYVQPILEGNSKSKRWISISLFNSWTWREENYDRWKIDSYGNKNCTCSKMITTRTQIMFSGHCFCEIPVSMQC